MLSPLDVPTFNDVLAAKKRISARIHRTPVLTSRSFNALVGAEVFFKCENFQRAGAFKARGAMNAIFSLDDVTAARGVVAHSSGNHGAAVALAARDRGISAHLALPSNTSPAKVAAIERYGAHIEFCTPTLAAREITADKLLSATGGTLVHPFNDSRVIAGQGTAALELLEEVPAIRTVLAPVSGGGLLTGTALAAHGIHPDIRVIGTEPATVDDAARSLASGRLEINPPGADTLADGLRATLSPLTLSLAQQHGVKIVTVSEAEIVRAMRLFWEIFKVMIETSSAVPVAALLEKRVHLLPSTSVGIIITGGNVDLSDLPWR